MAEVVKLNDVYPEWAQLFSYMPASAITQEFDQSDLDVQFFAAYGDRPISPLVEHFLNDDGEITTSNKQRIAEMIWARFGKPWLRKFAVLGIEYNPIFNVDYTMNETTTHTGTDTLEKAGSESDTLTKSGTETNTLTKTGRETDTETDAGSETRTTEIDGSETNTRTGGSTTSGNDSNNVFGFNTQSEDGVPSSKVDTEQTQTYNNLTDTKEYSNRADTETIEFNGRTHTTQRDFVNREDESVLSFGNRQDSSVHNFTDRTDTQTKDLTDETERTLRGNYNATTTQQMIQQEIDLWKWDFLADIFRDAAGVLALPIYN